MTQTSLSGPGKMEKGRIALPPPARKNSFQNNKQSAIICTIIWLVISLLAQFYTLMAIRKTLYGADLVTEDYKEEIVRNKENNSNAGRSNEMRLCASMKKETISMVVMGIFGLLAMMNITASVLHIYGVMARNVHFTLPYVFASGLTFVVFTTTYFVLLFTENAKMIFGTRGTPLLMSLGMILLMFHPTYHTGYLIDEAEIQKTVWTPYVRAPRVKSKGGLIHIVTKIQAKRPPTPKKMLAIDP